MTSLERRTRERAETRQAILEAAKELLADGDFENVSMRRIAEKIDYSPTAIYLHFKDKGELMDALAAEGFARLVAALDEAEADAPAQRLRQKGHAYVAFALGNRPAYRLMFLLGEHPQSVYEGHNTHRVWSARAFGILESGVRELWGQEVGAAGTEPDAVRLAAGVFWAHLHGAVALTLMGRGRLLAAVQPQLCPQAVETAVAGLLASITTRESRA